MYVPGLQGANGIDFGDVDYGAERLQSLTASFAHFTIATDDHLLTTKHHIGGSFQTVDNGLFARVEIIELGFSDGIIDVHGRHG